MMSGSSKPTRIRRNDPRWIWGILLLVSSQLQSSLLATEQGDTAEAVSGPQSAERRAFVIRLEGAIEPGLQGFFERSLDIAIEGGAEIVVLDIDSPGGRLDTTLEMVARLRRVEGVEIVAFIRQAAYSGAAMLALACDRIEMHPEAQLGDIGVIVGGPFTPFQYVQEKQRSPIVAQIRTLAEVQGRPAALAEAMVDKDANVFSVTRKEDGKKTFMTAAEWESLSDPQGWEKGPQVLESRPGYFLTVSGDRAVELGLAEATSRSLDGVLGHVGATRPVTVLAWSWVDSLVNLLNSFWITGLLLLIGFLALLFELSSPGMGIGGLLAFFCFALFFWSRFLGGTAGWLEVTLFISALAFLAAELFLIPGFGVAGVSGVLILVLSLVMASRRFLVPQSGDDWGDLGLNLMTVVGALVVVMLAVFFAADHLSTLPLFRRLVLQPPSPGEIDVPLLSGGKKGEPEQPWLRITVGDLGYSVSPLRPSGKAQFADDLLDVATEGEFIATATPIRVIRKQGNRIFVREA